MNLKFLIKGISLPFQQIKNLLFLTLVLASLNLQSQSDVIVSAFFGLDNTILGICPGVFREDGMPLNFKYPINETTLDDSDFEILDKNGNVHSLTCAVMQPADELGEMRTVLLIGEFGDHPDNPPVEVRIISDLFTLGEDVEQSACMEAINLKGSSTQNIIPLDNGPTLFFGQRIEGSISECPAGTLQTIQVAWNGGVRPLSSSVAESDLHQYYTVLAYSDTGLVAHTPLSIADIGDSDNFHQLCMGTSDSIVKVSFIENIVRDPNMDPNPFSEIYISYCSDVTSSLSISDFSNEELKIFPNPAQSSFFIKNSLKGEVAIEIFDLSGKLVFYRKKENTKNLEINCSDWAPGIYFTRCENGEKTVLDKFLKI